MTVSQETIDISKARAIKFLETNIVTLALSLDVDMEQLSGSFTIPVPENDPLYANYACLKKLCLNLEKLQ